MDFWSKLGFALAIGGIGLSIAVFFATYMWHEMRPWLARLGFGFGLLLCAGAVACFVWISEPEEPDVILSFVGEKDPMLQIHNTSGVVASGIKWVIAGFDVRSFSQARKFLQIPATTFDFLPAHSSSLPTDIFRQPLVAPFVKEGDKIVGSVSIHCPSCKRGHTYVFSIIFGTSGWYGEDLSIKNGNILTPNDLDDVEKGAAGLEERIPITARISIAEPQKIPAPR